MAYDVRSSPAWWALRKQVIAEETFCWLCNDPVDKSIRGTTRWSVSVDHVIPIHDRPDLALVRSNTRLAHYGCNARKGLRVAQAQQQQGGGCKATEPGPCTCGLDHSRVW